MHRSHRRHTLSHRIGWSGKSIVMGLLERNAEKGKSRVKARMVKNTRRRQLHPEIREQIIQGSSVYTDFVPSYKGLDAEYIHKVIDQAECYANGKVHTNGLENFWCLLKRAIRGTYVNIEPFHLLRYLDEQCFRFNQRYTKDGGWFVQVLGSILGRRLTYKALIRDAVPETC